MKIKIDAAMLVLMPLLMSYSLVGEAAHEWLGIGITALFIAHHIINRSWHKTLFKGKYTAKRIVMTAVDILLTIDILLLIFSGVNLSEHIFPFLPQIGSASLSRVLHLVCSHWG